MTARKNLHYRATLIGGLRAARGLVPGWPGEGSPDSLESAAGRTGAQGSVCLESLHRVWRLDVLQI